MPRGVKGNLKNERVKEKCDKIKKVFLLKIETITNIGYQPLLFSLLQYLFGASKEVISLSLGRFTRRQWRLVWEIDQD